MAKRKKNNQALPQQPSLKNTSQVDTDQFVKGMIKDTSAGLVQNGNWSHARNAINNSSIGDAGVIGNEPANLHCAKIPYTVIGGIHLYGDKWIIFSTNDIDSELGAFDDSQCHYETLVNDPCLALRKRHLITGASKENFDCSWEVYWDDGLNPSRSLNIDNIPWVQVQVTGPLVDGRDCVTYMAHFPEEGDMFIFPAWLKHWVSPYKSDVVRVSVSGNIHNSAPLNQIKKGELIGEEDEEYIKELKNKL